MKINPKVVDLYHWDVIPGWDPFVSAGIVGVIHKASQGAHDSDPAYSQRRSAASAKGLLWGAYHFNGLGTGKAQAAFFLQCAKPDSRTLLALDFEDVQEWNMSLATAVEFLEAVHDATGQWPVLYSGNRIKETIVHATAAQLQVLRQCRLWLAQYGAEPKLVDANGKALPWSTPFLWQYTGDGAGPKPNTVPGVHGPLDLNSFAGTDDELRASWVQPNAGAAASAISTPAVKGTNMAATTTTATATPTPTGAILNEIQAGLNIAKEDVPILSTVVGLVPGLGGLSTIAQYAGAAITLISNAIALIQQEEGKSLQQALADVANHLTPGQPNSSTLTS